MVNGCSYFDNHKLMAKVLISSFKLHLASFNFFEIGSIKKLVEL